MKIATDRFTITEVILDGKVYSVLGLTSIVMTGDGWKHLEYTSGLKVTSTANITISFTPKGVIPDDATKPEKVTK